ncbi:MAG: AMP-binding protein, partial [Firmicutes bacterium]|nr:AMP-binding protein [Bacillota bacterium]
LTSIKVCVSGSAPLPAEAADRFEVITDGKLVESYGLTEASPMVTINPVNGVRKPGSIGLPVSDTDCAIVNLDTGDKELPPGEKFDYYGQVFCEDCYMAALTPPRSCDPGAVSSALSTRRHLGQTGTQGLTELQRKIYDHIREKGSVERTELFNYFGLPQWEMEKQFAVLRHCELIRAYKEGDKVFVTLFESGDGRSS